MFKFKQIITALSTLLLTTQLSQAERITVPAEEGVNVASAIEKVADAAKANDMRIFATVDYERGAQSVGQSIRPTKLIIFGGPNVGAPIFQQGQTIGLYLPLRILAFEDANEQVWISYEDPVTAAIDHGLPGDHPAILKMKEVLVEMTGLARGG